MGILLIVLLIVLILLIVVGSDDSVSTAIASWFSFMLGLVGFSMDEYTKMTKDPDNIRGMIDKCIQREDYEEAERLTQILHQIQ